MEKKQANAKALLPILVFLTIFGEGYLTKTIMNFPDHIIAAIFCFAQIALYLYAFFDGVVKRVVGLAPVVATIAVILIFFNAVDVNANTNLPDEPSFSSNAVIEMDDSSYGEARIVDAEGGYVSVHMSKYGKTTMTVKDGDKTLAEGTDYTVSGNTGTETGSYTLTVTGIGDYTGAFVNFWKIVSGNVSITYETPVESTTVTAQVGQMMKIIAPETDDGGKNFAYWQDADGKIISYSSDYRFIVKKPMVLTAVYAEVSEPGKVLILEAAKASHDGRNNVCLTFDRSIPYDQDIIGAGIIYTTNKLLGDSTNTEDLRSKDGFGSDSIIAALKARGTNVIVDNFDETSCNGTINVYIPVGNNTDAYIYAIAYVASENGDETVYDYSELVAATYNTAAEM